MEAGGTFFAFRAGDVAEYFRLAGIGVQGAGLRSASVGAEQRSTGPLAPLASVKRNAFYESGKNCTQGFGTDWGGSRRVWGTDTGSDQGGKKWRHISGRRNFYVTGADMGNPAAEQSGIGGGVYDG